MSDKRIRVVSHAACLRLPDVILGRGILAFCSGTELLLSVELVCTQFRTLSLNGEAWNSENVDATALPALQYRASTQTIAQGTFLASGRLRRVACLSVMLCSSDLHWLQQTKLLSLRSLRLSTQHGLLLRPKAFEPLLGMTSLTVRARWLVVRPLILRCRRSTSAIASA